MTSRIRAFLRHAWVYLLYYSGRLAWAKRQVVASRGTIGLTFHRVLSEEERRTSNSPAGMVISVKTFAALADYIARECVGVDLKDAGASPVGDQEKPRMAITFDDGWLDNAVHAAPILRQRKLPCAIFLCSEMMGKTLPFWPERVTAIHRAADGCGKLAKFKEIMNRRLETPLTSLESQSPAALIERIKRLSSGQREQLLQELDPIAGLPKATSESNCDATMSWEQARQLAAEGVRFGSHTLHHEILTNVPEADARREILESAHAIEAKLGQPCKWFAYPNGSWSPGVRDCVAYSGYEFAFANKPGVWTKETDHWAIPRCNIWEGAVVDASGKFSAAHFEYIVYWRPVRSSRNG
ncbi:MAG TPA: polysaccharide deacetylase family protein [Candidatus Limnocylindrales bacterium]|nr:polysaccharide deacetylase family protein [Candidatus Limnocylindrales bacterium]